MREQGLRPGLDILRGLGSEGGYLWRVFKDLKGMVKKHRKEKKELDRQDRIIARPEMKSGGHAAKDEIKNSGDE